MTAYRAVFSARFRSLLQYRAAAMAGLVTQSFWGGIRMMIFLAFYENAPADLSMSYDETVAYVWLGQAFLALFPFRADGEVAQLIRTGNVAYELLRPVDLYNLWYFRAIANRTAPAVLRAGPILLLASLAGWLPWPGFARLGGFILLMLAAVLISAGVTMLMNISMFWTISGLGISSMISSLMYLLSGMLCPLPMFPKAWQAVVNVLPFRAMCDAPFRLFAGDLPLTDLPGLLLFALAWAGGLVVVGRLLLARAGRRLVVQGG